MVEGEQSEPFIVETKHVYYTILIRSPRKRPLEKYMLRFKP
jgi:hypothetical protein